MKGLKLKFILFIIILISVFTKVHSADYTLHGFMGVQGGETFEYLLKVTDSANGFYNGVAYTRNNNQQYVKAKVLIQWDKATKTLSISEKNILENKNFQSRATICLIQAKLSYNDTLFTISGALQSITSSNENCAHGSLQFINKEEILNFINGVPNKTTPANEVVVTNTNANKKTDSTKNQTKIIPKKPEIKAPVEEKKIYRPFPEQPKEITKGKSQEIVWHSDQIILKIWDGGIQDNDEISILFNGNPILVNYTLVKAKKEIVIPYPNSKENNIITIQANSEGNEPPNTANIELIDETETHQIIANNNRGNAATIILKR